MRWDTNKPAYTQDIARGQEFLIYRKVPKFRDTRILYYYHPKIQIKGPNLQYLVQKMPIHSKQWRPWSDCSSRSSLIGVCTVCPSMSVQKFRIFMVFNFLSTALTWRYWLVCNFLSLHLTDFLMMCLIWAGLWENLLSAYVKNKGSDQLQGIAQLIRAFVWLQW